MQVGIFRMPPAVDMELDRRRMFSVDALLRSVGGEPYYRISVHDRSPQVVLGSLVNRLPQNLWKMVHISHDNQWIFETVFAKGDHRSHCLYTKIISSTIDIAISMQAIREYTPNHGDLIPLSEIAERHYWNKTSLNQSHPIHSLIPPVFTDQAVDTETMRFIDIHHTTPYWRYKPIYDHEPSLLEGLVSGYFIRDPFYEVRAHHPQITFTPDRWFGRDLVFHKASVACGDIHIHHEEFDEIVLSLLSLRPASIATTCLLSHAVDGLLDLTLTNRFTDPYLKILPIEGESFKNVKQSLSHLLFECVLKYCEIYDINYHVFVATSNDKSSICLEKNIYDEVSISIHDTIHDRYVCFYAQFSTLALGTMGVGRYVQHNRRH